MTPLERAELIDALRIFPRLSLLLFWVHLGYVTYWYTMLPEPTTQQASFAGVAWSTLVPFLGWYMSTGRMWGAMNGGQARRFLDRRKDGVEENAK